MRRTFIGALATHLLLAAYYRYRPQPDGVNGEKRTYRVPSEHISFFHDSTWYESGERKYVKQITEEVTDTVRKARSFVLIDMFLFNRHHVSEGDFIPTTRKVADAFRGKDLAAYFITDPLNTSYGTEPCNPLDWLRQSGVEVCMTDLDKLRDNNLIYSPFWRAFLQWFGTGRSGIVKNPLQKGKTTTIRAFMKALNGKSNHRKVVIADEADSYVTMLTSANLDDSDSYFLNTGLKIKSQAVARHFLEAEKAVARMSGCTVSASIPPQPTSGDAEVTPLMGQHVKEALISDLQSAVLGDELYAFFLFLTERAVIEALIEAARRGVDITLILDPNKDTFVHKEYGFPNPVVAAELTRHADVNIRWTRLKSEELHAKFFLLKKDDTCVINTGSANLSRRSLSNTNLEANVRVEAPLQAEVCQEALHYARWFAAAPRSWTEERSSKSALAYWAYRVQEVTGVTIY